MDSRIRHWMLIGAGTLALFAVVFLGFGRGQSTRASGSGAARVERGEYLVAVAGCNDCHTPWVMGPEGPRNDMTRMLSGHPAELRMPEPPLLADGPWSWTGSASFTAFAGPWGISYAANLTPDEETGIGLWSEEMFVGAMRNGRHWNGSRPILPPMPWENVAKLTDEDLLSVFAYLKSVPPVRNDVPQPIIAPISAH